MRCFLPETPLSAIPGKKNAHQHGVVKGWGDCVGDAIQHAFGPEFALEPPRQGAGAPQRNMGDQSAEMAEQAANRAGACGYI